VEAIESAIHSTIQFASHLKDVAEQEQLNTDQVQKLAVASKSIGLNDEFAAQALSAFGKARKEMAEGRSAEAVALRKGVSDRFGVSQDDLNNSAKSNLDLAEKIEEAYHKMVPTPADTEMVRELFPVKHGEKMIGVLEALHKQGNIPLIHAEDIERLKHAEEVLSEFERRKMIAQADIVSHPNPERITGHCPGRTGTASGAGRLGKPYVPRETERTSCDCGRGVFGARSADVQGLRSRRA
jgi:hypothetical protein